MLIDTREPEPDPRPRRPRRQIDWRLMFWSFESAGLFVAASSLAGFAAVGLAFGGIFALWFFRQPLWDGMAGLLNSK